MAKDCLHCGSTLVYRYGREHCTGNNLYLLKQHFDKMLALDSESDEFKHLFNSLGKNPETLDLFVSFWQAKRESDYAYLECPFNELKAGEVSIIPATTLPMPSSSVPLPDLAEVYLAEHMLGRGLTYDEKIGNRHIPKINEEGEIYFAPLKWLDYPHSFSTDYKDMYDKTDYDAEPLEPIFDFEALDGLYLTRGNK